MRAIVADAVREELAKAAAKPTPAPELISVKEYARRRTISKSTVRAAIRQGRLPALKIGTAVRIQADAEIGRAALAIDSEAGKREARRARLLGKA